MIVIASAFRNASVYIPRYVEQVTQLCKKLPEARLLLVHGDSTDSTQALLESAPWPVPCELFAYHHGGRVFGSVDTVERWTQIALVWNALLGRVRADDDIFILVESDLRWEPEAILHVLAQLSATVDGCTAMVWFQERFYDTWGHRSGGVCFQMFPPYHPAFTGALMPMDSSGSLMVVKAEFARQARFTPELGIVGWCDNLRAAGAGLWLDPDAHLTHPPYEELRAGG